MYVLVCKRKEMLLSPQWDVTSHGIGPAYLCFNWINTSLAGALRTAEDMSFTSWTLRLGDAVFPRLQAELVILALMMLFGKYSTYWIAERIFTITQLTLRPRGKEKKKKKRYNWVSKCYFLNSFWLLRYLGISDISLQLQTRLSMYPNKSQYLVAVVSCYFLGCVH